MTGGTYHQEVILAMELDRRHIGKLVQIITDSWSMTGTLKRVDQHDNREWRIEYPSTLVPSGGEIYSTLHIGPWVGDVIGNQPVTVETVAGTLEAPEGRACYQRHELAPGVHQDIPHKHQSKLRPFAPITRFISDEEMADARAVVAPAEPKLTKSGVVVNERTALAMTEPGFLEGTMVDDLPPEPPAEWHKR